MTDPTNLARDVFAAQAKATPKEEAGEPGSGPGRSAPRLLSEFDFENPDEKTLQFIEEQWVRFCRSVGLECEVPDIRATFTAPDAEWPTRRRKLHWLVRPFAAVRDWFITHP